MTPHPEVLEGARIAQRLGPVSRREWLASLVWLGGLPGLEDTE